MKLKWQAIDKDGTVYRFTHKPFPNHILGIWDADRKPNARLEKIGKIGRSSMPSDWTKSLTRI